MTERDGKCQIRALSLPHNAGVLACELSQRLDRKNPRAKEDITHLPPAQLAESILEKEKRIAHIVGNIKDLLARKL